MIVLIIMIKMARFVYRLRNETAHPDDARLKRITDEMERVIRDAVKNPGGTIKYSENLLSEVDHVIATGEVPK